VFEKKSAEEVEEKKRSSIARRRDKGKKRHVLHFISG